MNIIVGVSFKGFKVLSSIDVPYFDGVVVRPRDNASITVNTH